MTVDKEWGMTTTRLTWSTFFTLFSSHYCLSDFSITFSSCPKFPVVISLPCISDFSQRVFLSERVQPFLFLMTQWSRGSFLEVISFWGGSLRNAKLYSSQSTRRLKDDHEGHEGQWERRITWSWSSSDWYSTASFASVLILSFLAKFVPLQIVWATLSQNDDDIPFLITNRIECFGCIIFPSFLSYHGWPPAFYVVSLDSLVFNLRSLCL